MGDFQASCAAKAQDQESGDQSYCVVQKDCFITKAALMEIISTTQSFDAAKASFLPGSITFSSLMEW